MNKQNIEYYKNKLLGIREKIVKMILDIDKRWSKTLRDSGGDISAYATHLADLGSDSDEREKETYMLERELKNLKTIDKALQRIYNNSYGKCTYCGNKISKKRLEAIPYTDLCIDCKKNIERKNYRI